MDEKRKDLINAIIAIIACLAIYKIFGKLVENLTTNENVKSLIAQLIFASCVFIAMILCKKSDIFRKSSIPFAKYWATPFLLVVQMILVSLVNIDKFFEISIPGVEVVFFLIQMILVGFCEEVLFRGLLQRALHNLFGEDSWILVIFAVLITGVCFGGVHLVNAFNPKITLRTAALQALSVLGTGTYFCAIYYRSGKNIWYLIFLHGLWDVIASVASGRLAGKTVVDAVDVASQLTVSGILPLVGIYLLASLLILRPNKVKEVVELTK